MKDRLRNLLLGTPFEPLARKVHATLTGSRDASDATGVDKNRMYDRQTSEVMRRVLREETHCVDVGCHRGSILQEMLRFSPRGQHFAFEPLPGMYADLRKAFGGRANVHLHECALSDVAGTTSFQHVVSNPAYSGLRPRRYDRPHEQLQEIQVRTERLDAIVPADTRIGFIKIDVEGGELQVLRGAARTIRTSRPVIVFEHGLGGADYYGTHPGDVHDLLAGECGLRLFVMADWLAGPGTASLSRQGFCEQFSSGSQYYFMAAA